MKSKETITVQWAAFDLSASNQLAIVFNSAPDWLRGFGEFSGTVTEQV